MPRLWKFFALDSAKYVVTEYLWAAKELGFGTAHRDARVKLERDKVQCANKIDQLEESIFGGPIALNSKWRKIISATYAETFPRIQVVPVFQPSPKCIVPNYSAWRNGVSGWSLPIF